ncbi:tryptophan synthase subunit alpha [Candidatus Falkowbacteria bacterium RIFCSPLOWO2_02_FULL_45_15]|uniref:Tryptophan synthase alpha chain n=1 Tax=Candidatus Falkowbacteria bacterium RIFCSPLOWO2_02_FULL_45_15 TaxID=1797988 RepID=A0A1F5S0L2_9BACT|nr:MAG: tryptophan synthase subunit alpha [Candidatus Falkowbacteria bacterium RIFCSPLOWO2_02_FULL_45_15]
MNTIDAQVKKIKSGKRIGLMTHIVVGYPDLKVSRQLIATMVEAGVDFIELQIPFSDPLADGPTLMRANQTALKHKIRVKDAMLLMAECSATAGIPLLFMTYFNIVFNYGVEAFCRDAAQAGCSGLIVPDMPLDEEYNDKLTYFAQHHNMPVIRTLAPVTSPRRLELNARAARGFLYLSGRQGVTGACGELDENIFSSIQRVKRYNGMPLAVGFGISRPTHIKQLKGYADIAVVGSEVLNIYHQAVPDGAISAVRCFVRELAEASR